MSKGLYDMEIIRTLKQLNEKLANVQSKSVGFVPTMGALHNGHLSLIEKARIENDLLVVSIFVNPSQFGPNEDLKTYPRQEGADLKLIELIDVDFVFIPEVSEIYPREMGMEITPIKRTAVLCGQTRPTHFAGVAMILIKLFNLVQPTRAYFGLKDAQQFAVIDLFVTDLNIPVEIIGLPTVRNQRGLALSSRNAYLSEIAYNQAHQIHAALLAGHKEIKNYTFERIKLIILDDLSKRINAKVEYVEILSYPELEDINELSEQIIIAVAIVYESARLIDNIIIHSDGTLAQEIRRNIQ